MGYLSRKREQRQQPEIVRDAAADYERTIAAVEIRATEQAEVTREWMQRVEASSVDIYFQGVLCMSIMAAGVTLSALRGVVPGDDHDESPTDATRALLAALDDDPTWRLALGVLTWAHVGEFVAANWPDRYDDAIEIAQIGLGRPTAEEGAAVAAVAAGADNPDTAARLHTQIVRAMQRAVEPGDPDATATFAVLAGWPFAWGEGRDAFNEQLDSYFPDGPPVT